MKHEGRKLSPQDDAHHHAVLLSTRETPQDGGFDLLVKRARILGRAQPIDIVVSGGMIALIDEGSQGHASGHVIDARYGFVSPSFVEPHFHVDKALTRSRLDKSPTDLTEAFIAGGELKRHFTSADVEARASESFRLAVAHGIGRMRVQVDVDRATGLTSLEGVLRAREQCADLLDIEIVAFPQQGLVNDSSVPDLLRHALAMGADVVGGGPNNESSHGDYQAHLDIIFDIAEEHDVAIDVHVDFSEDATEKALEMLADLTLQRKFQRRVTASHCCALATYSTVETKRVIEKVRLAGIGVCICPMGNLQMMGGDTGTPRGRGSSLPKELLAAGINVAAGTDNMNDVWYRFGRLDPLELGLVTCLSAGLRTDEEILAGYEMVTTRAARLLGAPALGVAEGQPADFVVFESQGVVDVLRNLPSRRLTVKRGRVVGGIESSYWAAE